MEIVIAVLISLAILLLVLSFFKKDRVAKLEEDLEQMTLTHMQDIYQLKRKIKILEEELLIQEEPILPQEKSAPSPKTGRKNAPVNQILKSQVLSLYQQGLSLDQIVKQSTLSKVEVLEIIEEQQTRGFSI